MAAGRAGWDLGERWAALGASGRVGDLADGSLLRRACAGDEATARAAFSALVERHGPMVLRVCRDVLGHAHDAEDAYQATFLVLARRAGSIARAKSVASWLHGGALKVSARAKVVAARRGVLERRAGVLRAERMPDRVESHPELHEALARLPARYHEPLILCDFEGLTTDEAAGRLARPGPWRGRPGGGSVPGPGGRPAVRRRDGGPPGSAQNRRGGVLRPGLAGRGAGAARRCRGRPPLGPRRNDPARGGRLGRGHRDAARRPPVGSRPAVDALRRLAVRTDRAGQIRLGDLTDALRSVEAIKTNRAETLAQIAICRPPPGRRTPPA